MKTYTSTRGFCHSQAILDTITKLWLNKDKEKMEAYFDWIEDCHFAVDNYLDCHPDIDVKFRTEGYQYFDILDLAKPSFREENRKWNAEIKQAVDEHNKGWLEWFGLRTTSVRDGKIIHGDVHADDPLVSMMLLHWRQ